MLRSLVSKQEREARLVRDGGWGGIVKREIRSKRLRLFGVTNMVFLFDELNEPPPRTRIPEGLHIEPYEDDDWSRFRHLAGPKQRRRFAARLAAGRKLLVAWRGDEPIGFTWIAGNTATMAMDGMTLDLPEGWSYGYGLYVHPDARGAGIGTVLTNARMHYAREMGYARICRVVRVKNVAAFKSAAKAQGSVEPAGRAELHRMFGRKWVRWTSPPA